MSYKLSLLERADAITPSIGNPTPVIKNPIVAGKVLPPANWPILTGNIKFPAQKIDQIIMILLINLI